jgi:hypothetical protein
MSVAGTLLVVDDNELVLERAKARLQWGPSSRPDVPTRRRRFRRSVLPMTWNIP